MDQPNPNLNPTDAQPQAAAGARLAALSLRGGRDLPPDFHTTEIHEHHTDDDDEGYLTAASRGKSSTCAWKEAPEGLRDDDVSPPSPSSSGYAGERGSSLGDDPDLEPAQDWPRDKKHLDEDDASSSWRKRKKHFVILSNSGKPIYSRYGDEHKLAGFSATLQAIISFVENSGDHIKFVRAGKHQIVFLVKGPIYLVCISCTEESYEGLRGQLELMYCQLLLILTKSVNRCFEKNPKYDMAPLLGGTDAVFLSLIHAFSWNPATFLHAYTCLPLAQSTRQAASAVLQDVADSGVLFALLMCDHNVISLVGAQKATLHPDDILLLANFILSSESFRTSVSFSPICLPRYNPMAFLYAYVHFFNEHTYLTLLTARSDAFYDLKDSRARIQNVLVKSNVLIEVQRSLRESALHVEDHPTDPSSQSASQPPQSSRDMGSQSLSSEMIGRPSGLWHFIYKSIYLDQYVSSEFPSCISNQKQQKRLYKAYQKLYASMHDKATGPHKIQFRRDEDYGPFPGPSWSDLPIDILLVILSCLELPQALAFATVCKAWRAAVMAAGVPCSSAPWLMSWAHLLEEREERGRTSSAVTCNFYPLGVNKAYGVSFPPGSLVACCGASYGWLVLVNELSNLVLYNLFTAAMIHLPPITDFACVKAVYDTKGNLDHYLESGRVHETTSLGTWFYQKAVLSCSPSKGGDYIVMVIHRDLDWLSFVKAGQSKWQVASILTFCGTDRYMDCAYHDGRFYTVTLNGMVERWDIDDLSKARRTVIVAGKMHVGPMFTRHLLSTPWGDLLQIRAHLERRYPDRIRFQIHRVGQDGCKKLSRKDLMDHALFLGINHSACLPTKNFPKLRAQCVYFSFPCMILAYEWTRQLPHGWGSLGGARIYDLKRRKFEHAFCIPNRRIWYSHTPSEVWITPNL